MTKINKVTIEDENANQDIDRLMEKKIENFEIKNVGEKAIKEEIVQ